MTSTHPHAHSPILQRLSQGLGELSLGQRRIAEIILEDPEDGAFGSVAGLAQKAGVSESAVLRFAHTQGFTGFAEFREALLHGTKADTREEGPVEKHHPSASPRLVDAARKDVGHVKRMLRGVSAGQFDAAIELLVRARHRLLLGRGLSSHMAETFGYLLTHVGLPCIPGYSSDLRMQVAHLEPCDLLVVFSFPPHASETQDAALMAKGRGVPVLAVSDSTTSPLNRAAELLLSVPGETPYFAPSLASFGVLAGALAAAAAEKDPGKALRRMRDVQRTAASSFRS